MEKVWKERRCEFEWCDYFGSLDRHHIVARSEGGSNLKHNLCFVCPNHHRTLHQKGISVRWVITSQGRKLIVITNQES